MKCGDSSYCTEVIKQNIVQIVMGMIYLWFGCISVLSYFIGKTLKPICLHFFISLAFNNKDNVPVLPVPLSLCTFSEPTLFSFAILWTKLSLMPPLQGTLLPLTTPLAELLISLCSISLF